MYENNTMEYPMVKFINKQKSKKIWILVLILISIVSSVSFFTIRAKINLIEKDLYAAYVTSLSSIMLSSKDPVMSIGNAISSLDLYYDSKSYFKLTREEISTRDFVRNLLFGVHTIKRRNLDDSFLNEDWDIIYLTLYGKIEEKGVFTTSDLLSTYDDLRNENLKFLFTHSFLSL